MHTGIKALLVGVVAAFSITQSAFADTIIINKEYRDGHRHGHHDWRGKHDRHDRGWHNGWHKSRDRYYSRPYYSNNVVITHYPATAYYDDYYYNQPVAREIRCTNSNNPLGMLVGGVAGGIIGNNIGKGDGRTVATIAGTLIGGTIGHGVSERCSERVFRNVDVGTPVSWYSPNSSDAYRVVPVRDFRDDGRYCREYQATARVGGRIQETYGQACMQPDGSWEIID